jgi:hypothetical protein
MNYVVEIGLGVMLYTPSLIKNGSVVQKLIGGIHIQTHRQEGNLISLILFFQRKTRRLKRNLWKKAVGI